MTTMEDASKLIETILIVSALLLSFSVSALQQLTHDDILEADKRWVLAATARDDTKSDTFIPSTYLLARIFISLGIFATILITSTTIYGSLMFSGSRASTKAFNNWFNCMKYFILLEYCALLVGIIMLLHVNLSLVDIAFPLYHKDGRCFGGIPPFSGCISENVTFDLSDIVDCRKYFGASNCIPWIDFVHVQAVQYYQKNTIIVFSVGAGFAVVLHVMIVLTNKGHTRNIWKVDPLEVEGVEDVELQISSLCKKYDADFKRESITADQYTLLNVQCLTSHLRLPLGDALRLHELVRKNQKLQMMRKNVIDVDHIEQDDSVTMDSMER